MADAFYVQFSGLAVSRGDNVIIAALAGILLSVIEVKMADKRDH
jgi:hypothetical protein